MMDERVNKGGLSISDALTVRSSSLVARQYARGRNETTIVKGRARFSYREDDRDTAQ